MATLHTSIAFSTKQFAQGTLIAGLVLMIAAASAMALPRGVNDAGKTKKDLENDGYKCEVVSANFYECKKSGSTTYWCDGTGACTPAPTRHNPNQNPTKGIRAPSGSMRQ